MTRLRKDILSRLFLPLDELSAEITQLKRENAALRARLEMRQNRIDLLEHTVEYLCRHSVETTRTSVNPSLAKDGKAR